MLPGCLLLHLSLSLSASEYSDRKYDINRNFIKRIIIVFVINSRENQESEQYTDWSHRLNDYVASVGDKYVFYQLNTNIYSFSIAAFMKQIAASSIAMTLTQWQKLC